tara:strand:- start:2392 stop:3513 length:1122 start_codon:yes stop_codon:yes gene_type:complete
MNQFIPVNEPIIGEKEKNLVMECLNSGWISSEGPFVAEFEDSFSKFVNRRYGISCSSGSGALDIAIAALGIGPGDEVILPTFTIISCAASIIRAGAKPIVIDADINTWNLDATQLESSITPKTVAIMMVHIYSHPADVDKVLEVAKKYKLSVIEDSAELIGAEYKGKKCGGFGDISTFSFYPNKQITTGEGGMITTNDSYLAERCRSLRNLCFQKNKRFIHEELGWNYRMTNLQAALGIGQLSRIEEIIKKKRKIGNLYNQYLRGIKGIKLPLQKTSYSENIYWVYGLLVDEDFGDAQKIMNLLSQNGIGTRPFFYPMHKQPVLKKMGLFKDNPKKWIADRLYKQGFYIPSGLSLTDENILKVSEKIKNIFSS